MEWFGPAPLFAEPKKREGPRLSRKAEERLGADLFIYLLRQFKICFPEPWSRNDVARIFDDTDAQQKGFIGLV